jgi:hypothetical protein
MCILCKSELKDLFELGAIPIGLSRTLGERPGESRDTTGRKNLVTLL